MVQSKYYSPLRSGMTLTPSTRLSKISRIENHKNHCVIAKSCTVKSLLLGDPIIAGLKQYDNLWKRYFSDTLNFGRGSDCVKNAFWIAISLPIMLYLENAIILCGTNNINKDSPFDIAECHIKIGEYFKERFRNVKIFFSGILPRNEYCSVNRITTGEINDILADKCSLHWFYFIDQKYGWTMENGMLNPNFYFKDNFHLI